MPSAQKIFDDTFKYIYRNDEIYKKESSLKNLIYDADFLMTKQMLSRIQKILDAKMKKEEWNLSKGLSADETNLEIYKAIQRTIDNERQHIEYDPFTEGYNNPPLMTVRNQLMNKLGDDYTIRGGTTVPKITISTYKYPEVSFDILPAGKNVEITPKYNNVPDTLHKKKGIAFNQAAKILYDFISGIIKEYSKKNEGMRKGMKLTIKESDISGSMDALPKYTDFWAYKDTIKNYNVDVNANESTGTASIYIYFDDGDVYAHFEITYPQDFDDYLVYDVSESGRKKSITGDLEYSQTLNDCICSCFYYFQTRY